MKVITKIIDKFMNLFNGEKNVSVDYPIYFENGSALICKDKVGDANFTSRIVAEHADENRIYPRFTVINSSSRDGMFSMHVRKALTLDTDEMPTEGSDNLLTSGAIYYALNNLQKQIDDINSMLK